MKFTFFSGSLFFFVFFIFWPQHLISSSSDLEEFLQRASRAVESIGNLKPHSVKVLTVISEMDKRWQPQKVTRIEKVIVRKDSIPKVTVLKAVEIAKGKEKDVTQKVREQIRKNQEKNPKSGAFRFDHLFAFTKENRANFNFVFGPDSSFEGHNVKVLKATAKEPNEELLNGEYLFDADNLSILEAVLVPSKNPKMVKEMKVYVRFGPSNDGHYVLKSFSMRSYTSMLIKNFRVSINEIYSNYKFF